MLKHAHTAYMNSSRAFESMVRGAGKGLRSDVQTVP